MPDLRFFYLSLCYGIRFIPFSKLGIMPGNGGIGCSIMGCGAHSTKSCGLSFHSLPKNDPEWRDQLLKIINRSDNRFNPNRAAICSRHYESSCFKKNPSLTVPKKKCLIKGSLPTLHLKMEGDFILRPLKGQKKPKIILLPYTNLDDIRKESENLFDGWRLLNDTPTEIVIGLVIKHSLIYSLVVKEDLTVEIGVMGIPMIEKVNIANKRLHRFCSEINQKQICYGIEDSDLQNLADFPNEADKSYHRVMSYNYRDDESVLTSNSAIMSRSCLRLLQEGETFCNECKKVKMLLLNEH